MLTLPAFEAIIRGMSTVIGASVHALPTFGRNEDGARPEIRIDSAGYHFIVIERGQEIDHQIFSQLEEVLFHIFEGITFSMASDYELRNRVETEDFRIVLFTKQLQLLKQIDASFAERQLKKCEFYLRGIKLKY